MSQSRSISVVGSVNLDFTIRTQTLPIPGETIGQGEFFQSPGGKGANVAVALQRLGATAELWACVGEDVFADAALDIVNREGVSTKNVRRIAEAPTGIAFINVATSGENQIAVASGANMHISSGHMGAIEADALITQFEIPKLIVDSVVASFKSFTCVNCSPVGPPLAPLLPHADLLIFNEREFAFYENELSSFAGLVAVTFGALGAKLFEGRNLIAQAAPLSVNAIDTTGAGDSFAAALTLALIEGAPPREALQFACTVGALTTTKLGAQTASPTRREVSRARS